MKRVFESRKSNTFSLSVGVGDRDISTWEEEASSLDYIIANQTFPKATTKVLLGKNANPGNIKNTVESFAGQKDRRRRPRRVRDRAPAHRSSVPQARQCRADAASRLRQRAKLPEIFSRHRRGHPRLPRRQAGARDRAVKHVAL